jgi:long-chain acyl-CoA synthetase
MTTEQKLTLRDVLLESAERWPDRPALGAVGSTSKTFSQTVADAATWSSWLQGLGLKKGDRVAILAESRAEWGAAYFGITAAGLVAVPILPDFAAQQVSNILEHSETKAAISSSKLGGVMESAVSMSEQLPDDLPRANLESRVIIGGLGKDTVLGEPMHPHGMFDIPLHPDDIAVILYTSGTTGTSKGVTLTHNAIAWNASISLLAGLGPGPEDVRHLSVLPLAHTYECTIGLVGILSVGGEVKYLNGPPTPSRLIKAMGEVKPTVILTVPLLMEKIYRSRIAGPMKSKPALKFLYSLPPVRKLIHFLAGRKVKKLFGGKLRFFGVGGAPIPRDVERFLVESRFPYSVGYGLTETAPLLAGGATTDMKFRSTGKVLPGVSVRISDPNERGVGEIQAKGPNVMSGYWKDPDRTSEVFTEDGWFRTGDLGAMSNETLYIKGRLKDVILGSNGENIYPDEVESVINGHSFVAESIAYIKDGNLVARILLDAEKIAAEAKRLGLASAEKIADWKRELLERTRKEANKQLGRNAKISAFIEQMRPFEKTPSLKIKRFLYTGPQGSEA